mgnify:FL=1
MRILTLTKETQQNILENLLKRSPNSYGEYEGRVNAIIEEVRANRDAAVFSYTKSLTVPTLMPEISLSRRRRSGKPTRR